MNEQNNQEEFKQVSTDKAEAEISKHFEIIRLVNSLPILDYRQFLDTIKISGRDCVGWSAEGIKSFSLVFKVSVGEIKLMEPPEHLTDKGMMFSAMGTNHIANITAPAMIYQPFETTRGGKLVPDPYWVEKGTTRIDRNTRRNLIPAEMLITRLQNEIANAENKEAAIKALMADVTTTWDMLSEKLAPLTKRDCLQAAEQVYGAQDLWDEIMWKQFIVDLRAHEDNYLASLRAKKAEAEPQAETEAEEKAEREPGEEG